MKAVKTTLEGVTYYLVLNGEAMFQIRDSFDSTKLLLEAMQKTPARASRPLAPPPRSSPSRASLCAAGSDTYRAKYRRPRTLPYSRSRAR